MPRTRLGLLLLIFGCGPTLPAQDAGRRIDVNEALRTGRVRLVEATRFDLGALANVFDDDAVSLARSANINPMVITLEFPEGVPFTSMRCTSGSAGTWTIESAASLDDLRSRTGSWRQSWDTRPLRANVSEAATISEPPARYWQLTLRRTVGDNFVHLRDWQILTSLEPSSLSISTVQTEMYPTWRTNLVATASAAVPLRDLPVRWRSHDQSVATVDEAGRLTAIGPGSALIEASSGQLTARIELPVQAPAREPETVYYPEGLAKPAPDSLYEIPVAIFRYLPTRDGIDIDPSYDSDFWNLGRTTVENIKANIDRFDQRIKFMLEEGSRFRGYKHLTESGLAGSAPGPSLGYKVIAYFTVYEPTPPGRPDNPTPTRYFVDYESIFNRFNVRSLVEEYGVREIWFWKGNIGPDFPSYDPSLHTGDRFRVGYESEMMGPNGRVCNCAGPSGAPTYNRTYVLYNQNVRRTQAEAIHNHGHQLEAVLSFANSRDARTEGIPNLFWDAFSGRVNGAFQRGRCGNTHFPPNGEKDYDYSNPNPFPSDCEDWSPTGGERKPVSASTWGKLAYPWPAYQTTQKGEKTDSQYYIWWMQNMPGQDNGLTLGQAALGNWWHLTADWDASAKAGVGLLESPSLQSRDPYAVRFVTSPEVSTEGGKVSVQVDLPTTAKWIAVSNNEPWLQVETRWGAGPAQITVSVAANKDGPAREGSVVVAGRRLVIRQQGN